MKSTFFIFALFLLLMLSGCHDPVNSQNNEGTSTPATEASAQAADGSQESEPLTRKATWDDVLSLVSRNPEKVIVVDIWSTYCAPCLQEFPHLIELQNQHNEKIVCISFNINYVGLPDQTPDTDLPFIHKFLAKQASQVTNLVSTQTDEEVFAQLKIFAIPAIIIFNQQGEPVATVTEESAYENKVIPLVEQLLQ